MQSHILKLTVALALGGSALAHAYVVPADPRDPGLSPAAQRLLNEAIAHDQQLQKGPAHRIELNLDETVQLALMSNHDLAVARADYQAAEAKLSQAQAAGYPTVALGASWKRSGQAASVTIPDGVAGYLDRTRTEALGTSASKQLLAAPETYRTQTVATPTQEMRGLQLSLSLPLYTGGIVEGNRSAARMGREIAAARIRQVEQEVRLQATKAYFDALRARNLSKVSDLAVTDLEQHLATVQLQYQVGVAAKSDVLATEVALANAQTGQVQAHNAVALSSAALARIIAMPVDTDITLRDSDFMQTPMGIDIETATAYALAHRPDLAQAVLAVEAADAQIGIARAGYRPSVALTASKGWAIQEPVSSRNESVPQAIADGITKAGGVPAEQFTATPTGHGRDWSVGVQASWKLWDGGATRAQVRGAEAAKKARVEALANAFSGVRLAVRQAYLNVEEAAGMIRSSEVAQRQGEESFRIASLRYSAGVGTNLDVLDAEINLAKARTNYVNALYQYNVSEASLEQAMGVSAYIPFGRLLQNKE